MSFRDKRPFIHPTRLSQTATADELDFFFRQFVALMDRHGERRGFLNSEGVIGPTRLGQPENQIWLHCRSQDDLATYGGHPTYDVSVGATASVGEDDADTIRLSFDWWYPGPTLECRLWKPALRQGWGDETPAVWELIDYLHMAIAACGSDIRVLRTQGWVARTLNRLGCYRVPHVFR